MKLGVCLASLLLQPHGGVPTVQALLVVVYCGRVIGRCRGWRWREQFPVMPLLPEAVEREDVRSRGGWMYKRASAKMRSESWKLVCGCEYDTGK